MSLLDLEKEGTKLDSKVFKSKCRRTPAVQQEHAPVFVNEVVGVPMLLW